jgi:hypothetical protein
MVLYPDGVPRWRGGHGEAGTLMSREPGSLLLHPVHLIAVTVPGVNDHWLKTRGRDRSPASCRMSPG